MSLTPSVVPVFPAEIYVEKLIHREAKIMKKIDEAVAAATADAVEEEEQQLQGMSKPVEVEEADVDPDSLKSSYPSLTSDQTTQLLALSRAMRWRHRYEREGLRSVVRGVFLVHTHGTLSVLLMRGKWTGQWSLPGGHVRLGESPRMALLRKLTQVLYRRPRSLLQPAMDFPLPAYSPMPPPEEIKEESHYLPYLGCQVHEALATYWRLDYVQDCLPLLPPHVSRPKAMETLFLCSLPSDGAVLLGKACKMESRSEMHVGINVQGANVMLTHRSEPMEWCAVPLHDLMTPTSAHKFGHMISALPILLSRVKLGLYVSKGYVSWTPLSLTHDTQTTDKNNDNDVNNETSSQQQQQQQQ